MKFMKLSRMFAAGAILTLLASPAVVADEQQDKQVARSFLELSNYVSLGETVFVTDTSGKRSKAVVTEFAPTEIHLMQKGAEIALSEDVVRSIDVQYSDPLWTGAVIGGVVGAVVALPFALNDDFQAGPEQIPIWGALGAGIGLGFDALKKGRKPVYRSPYVQGTQLEFYPILSRDQKGFGVAISR